MERKIEVKNYFNENWIKADKPISEYPIGTKFKSISGGYWIKTERGYKWCTGATFPRVGGDYMGLVCLPEKISNYGTQDRRNIRVWR